MPWRPILFLLFLSLVIVFAGFNLENKSDISLGFYTFTDVPIFISIFVAFLVGAFFIIPFTVKKRGKNEPQNISSFFKRKNMTGPKKNELAQKNFNTEGKPEIKKEKK